MHERECAEYAAAIATEVCFLEGVDRDAILVLHAGNGGPMKGASMLATLQWLGLVSSFSRPRVVTTPVFGGAVPYPEVPPGVSAFPDIAAARAWVEQFVRWYNHEHQYSGIRFVAPRQRHSGQDSEILTRRHAVYQDARRRDPEHWRRETRNWTPVDAVELISYRPKLAPSKHQKINKAA